MPEGDALLGKSVGHYKLLRTLGIGGMGAVYLGEHPEIESRVAIKVLLPRFVEHPQITRRFLDEARAVNRIGHAGIVRIHDCGRQEGVGVYLVMELLEGKTVDELLCTDGRFGEERAVRVLRQTAAAVAASHQAGIIHRDLKPSNLFLVPDDNVAGGERVKVLDFGIAKLLEEGGPKSRELTQTGMVMGSLLFMSPEQCVDPKRVDARSDIYSLGAIGYHLLTGEYPFEAETLGQLALKHERSKPRPLRALNPDVSEKLEAMLHRALAVDREQRFGSMAELRDALGELLGLPSSSPPLRPSASAVTVSDRPHSTTTLSGTAGEQLVLGAAAGRRRLIAGVALTALLLGGGLIVWRTTGSGGPEAGPGSSVAAGTGSTDRLVRRTDAGSPSTPDPALRDRGRDPATAAHAGKRKPSAPKPAGKAAAPPRPRPSPGPAEEAKPQGEEDGQKKKKKAFFDDL